MAENKKTKDLGPCAVCGRAVFPWNINAKLKGGEQICGDCVSKIRLMYPAEYKVPKGKRKKVLADPVAELTIEQVREAMERSIEYVESLRLKYGANAVYEVEDISMEPHGWFRPPFIYAKGRCVFGYFDIEDDVYVVHRGMRTKAKLKGIKRVDSKEKGYENREYRGEGGFPYECFTVTGKDVMVFPGDIIIKDQGE